MAKKPSMTFCGVTISDHPTDPRLLRLSVLAFTDTPTHALIARDAIPQLCSVLTNFAGTAKPQDDDDFDIASLV